ncbi:nucleotide exchange factor GrpE [Rhodococcus aetherivorans]
MFEPESVAVGAVNDPVTLGVHLALITVVAAGCLLLGAMFAQHRRLGPGTPPPSNSAPAAMSSGSDTEELIDTLIRVHDLSHNDAVSSYVESCLARRGITRIDDPAGDPYDAGTHQVVATEPAPSPDRVGRVCHLVRPGWRHQHTIVRLAEVTVWTSGPRP